MGVPLWLMAGVMLAAAAAARFTFVSQSGSDARGALLTSETLLRTGSVRLDHLGDEAVHYGYRIHEHRGHLYYYFPLGSPLLALPAVAAANLAGYRLLDDGVDPRLQHALALLTVALTAGLALVWARSFVGPAAALVVVAGFVFGSPVMSTGATAYWSSNWAVVLNLAALGVLSGRRERVRRRDLVVLGSLLFWSYLCRPTGALPAAVCGVLVAVTCRRRAWPYFVTLAGWMALLVVWSLVEYGQPLPAYYLPGRIETAGLSRDALVGHLVSPSRGLLVHSPFLVAVAAGLVWRWRQVVRSPLAWGCLAWIGLHWLAISQFPHWWAGHSFGARLWTEAMPAFALLTLLVLGADPPVGRSTARRSGFVVLVLLTLFAFGINTWRGLYHDPSYLWNASPDIDHHPAYLMDWRYPQALATDRSNNERFLAHAPRLAPAPVGVPLPPTSPQLAFNTWKHLEWSDGRPFRWSRGTRPLLLFATATGADAVRPARLELELGSWGRRRITVVLDGRELGPVDLDGESLSTVVFDLPADWPAAETGETTGHVLEIRGLDDVGGRQNRLRIGVGFWGLKLVPQSEG